MLAHILLTTLFPTLWAGVARAEWRWVHLEWNDTKIWFDDSWKFTSREPQYSSRCSFAYTDVNGSRMSFSFTGTEFGIHGREIGSGSLEVHDNGRKIVALDLSGIGNDESCGSLLLRRLLPMGSHTIELIFRQGSSLYGRYGISYIWYAFQVPDSTASSTITGRSHRYSAEVVAGVALCTAFGFALLLALVWLILRCRRRNNPRRNEHDRFDIDEGVVPANNMSELDAPNPETGPVNLVTTSSDNNQVEPITGQSNTTDSLIQPPALSQTASPIDNTMMGHSPVTNDATESPARTVSLENRVAESQALREEDVQRIARAVWDQRGLSQASAHPPPYREL